MSENNSKTNYQPQNEQQPKELLWPPNGYVFEQESLLPAYCKPKICPLKSVTLEKLEKMQEEANRRLRELEEKEKQENDKNDDKNNEESNTKKADIWRADEEEEEDLLRENQGTIN